MEEIKISGVQDYCKCPNCSYNKCIYEWSSRGYEWWFCNRCGYNHDSDKKEKSLKPLGCHYSMRKKGLGGSGAYYNKKELQSWLDMVKNNIDLFEVAKYTYCKNGEYYIVDELTKTEMRWKDWELLEKL